MFSRSNGGCVFDTGHIIGKRLVVLVTLLVVATMAPAKQGAHEEKVIRLTGPTLIGYFPISPGGDKTDEADALDDFVYYLRSATQCLRDGGIAVHQQYAGVIRIQDMAGRIEKIVPSKRHAAYYFRAPGKPRRVELDIMTDSDIVRVLRDYLGDPIASCPPDESVPSGK